MARYNIFKLSSIGLFRCLIIKFTLNIIIVLFLRKTCFEIIFFQVGKFKLIEM